MEDNIRFVARPGFAVREIAGEQLLIPIDTGNIQLSAGEKLTSFNGMVRLNQLGLFLWNQLSQPKSLEELTQAVEAAFETKDADVQADIREYLDEGIRSQLIFLLPNVSESEK